jgi:hypothetical protein
MHRTLATVSLALLLPLAIISAPVAATITRHAVQGKRVDLCGWRGRTPAEHARQLTPITAADKDALLGFAQSRDATEVMCGVAGLAVAGDLRVIPHLAAALRSPALRQDAYQLARWATYMAAGPEVGLGAALRPVVETFDDRSLREAAGDDAYWFLGEVDDAAAKDRLVAALEQPLSDAGLDAVVHGLARQGEQRTVVRVVAIGREALAAKSGNATLEQARRLGEVAFYLLALGPDTQAEGLATLRTILPRDQQDAAAWAVHTLCARAARRPSDKAAIEAYRATLVAALDDLAIAWQPLRGRVGCINAP